MSDDLSTNTYVAAFSGALLGLRAFPGNSLVGRVCNLLSGFLMAVFVGPLLTDYMHLTSVHAASGITFVVGAAGLVVFAAVVEGIRQTPFGAIIASWLSRNRSP